jgi:protein SCO1/2
VEVQNKLKDRMGKDFFMYSISLKPDEEGPEKLAEYREALGAGPGWTFLTGRPEDIQMLRKTLGFYYPDDPALDVDIKQHLGFLLMGNEPYGWWGTTPCKAAPNNIVNLINWMAPGSQGFSPYEDRPVYKDE